MELSRNVAAPYPYQSSRVSSAALSCSVAEGLRRELGRELAAVSHVALPSGRSRRGEPRAPDPFPVMIDLTAGSASRRSVNASSTCSRCASACKRRSLLRLRRSYPGEILAPPPMHAPASRADVLTLAQEAGSPLVAPVGPPGREMSESPTVYLARAGRNGEAEDNALENCRAIVGFQEFPSLEQARNYAAVEEIVNRVYIQGPRKQTSPNVRECRTRLLSPTPTIRYTGGRSRATRG